MKYLIKTLFLVLLFLVFAAGAQAVTLTDLFNGGSITAGDKLFDNWSLNYYDSRDFRDFNSDNILVTALDDGGMNPGPGLSFSVMNGELDVSGDGIYNYVNLSFGFRASVLDPGLMIKDNSLQFRRMALYGLEHVGMNINERIGSSAGEFDLGINDVHLSYLLEDLTEVYTDSATFMPSSEIWISKDILVWATFEDERARLDNFEQRFSQTVVPEPSTFLLLGGGLAGLSFYARRRRKE